MPKGFEASDGWTNGYMFNVNWHKENVTFDGGNLQLIIDKEKKLIKYHILVESFVVKIFTVMENMKYQ